MRTNSLLIIAVVVYLTVLAGQPLLAYHGLMAEISRNTGVVFDVSLVVERVS